MPNIPLPQIRVSASAIRAFKQCPRQFLLGFILGVRPQEDSEVLRIGSSWHLCHETYDKALMAGKTPDEAMAEVVRHINDRYHDVPNSQDSELWGDEAQALLVWFRCYRWYYQYQEDDLQVLGTEVPFEFSISNHLGLPVPISEAYQLGKIDKVAAWHAERMVGNVEYKTTGREIGDGAEYWDKLPLDTQVSMYSLASRLMKVVGLEAYGIHVPEGYTWGDTIYDVFRKPTIKRKFLTQAETEALVGLETTEYFGGELEVECPESWYEIAETGERLPEPPDVMYADRKKKDWPKLQQNAKVLVGGEEVEVKPGAKGFAIKESRLMFGLRLQDEICSDPEKYFQRKRVGRTEKQLDKFQRELYSIFQAMKHIITTDGWYANENQCKTLGTCDYYGICHGFGFDRVAEDGVIPPGFHQVFRPNLEGEQA